MRYSIVPAGLLLGLVALLGSIAAAEPGPRPLSLDDLGTIGIWRVDPPRAPDPPPPTAFERALSAPPAAVPAPPPVAGSPGAKALPAGDLEAVAIGPEAAPAATVPAAVPATLAEPILLDPATLGGLGISRGP